MKLVDNLHDLALRHFGEQLGATDACGAEPLGGQRLCDSTACYFEAHQNCPG
jgi:hypothetical protein